MPIKSWFQCIVIAGLTRNLFKEILSQAQNDGDFQRCEILTFDSHWKNQNYNIGMINQ